MADPTKQPPGDIPNPFAGPRVKEKLKNDAKTKAYMEDPTFVKIIEDLGKDTQTLVKHMSDHRVMTALAVLLDVDITVPELSRTESDPFVHKPGEGPSSAELTGEHSDDEQGSSKKQKKRAAEPTSSTKTGSPQQEKALEEKEKGNAAYKKRDFTTALEHYDKAIELDPTNVTFLTNKAAVYFEQGEWDSCIETCELAVEKGRELRADFKIIAKAYARIGNVYVKQEKLDAAIKAYDHSLAEHRNQDVVKKREEAQKKLKEQERLAYIDPEKSLEVKAKGNELFKKGDFPGAVKQYTEAIRRNPDDAKLFSNRAACYQKLLEFPLALKDCEECIRLDPKFIKGHIRKGHALLGLKDTVKAMQAFQNALEIDPKNAEAKSGLERCMSQDDPEARRQAAMHDPEVQKILHDPAMQLILQQMQSNPAALRDHLQNPDIAAKIQKLIESGFISLR